MRIRMEGGSGDGGRGDFLGGPGAGCAGLCFIVILRLATIAVGFGALAICGNCSYAYKLAEAGFTLFCPVLALGIVTLLFVLHFLFQRKVQEIVEEIEDFLD